MISCTSQYLWHEARPRWESIFLSTECWLAIAIGLLVGYYGKHIDLGSLKVSDVIQLLLTYASIALGFCLAGLTLALTVPDRDFALKMAHSSQCKKPLNAYSDLLFVFSWTAIWHWVLIMAAVAILVFCGKQDSVLPGGSSILRRVVVGVIATVSSYCLFQFLITLITLSQVGNAYIKMLQETPVGTSKDTPVRK